MNVKLLQNKESFFTWAVVKALHMEQMASASSSVFFFTCKSWAAWMRGSRVSLAPLFIRFLSRSHSSSWLTLYLCPPKKKGETERERELKVTECCHKCLTFLCVALSGISVKWQVVFLFTFLKFYQLCLKIILKRHEVYKHNYIKD